MAKTKASAGKKRSAGKKSSAGKKRSAGKKSSAARRSPAAKKPAARKKPAGSKKSTAGKKATAGRKPPSPGKTASGGAKPAFRALCVGINDYPYEGNDLKGCVNDAKAWASLLTGPFSFAKSDVKMLLDDQATKKNVVAALKDLLTGARPGDVVVFTNSSHGSYRADKDGDEEKYDELLCPYDIDDNDLTDDELRELIADIKDGVRLTVILDNCFSGTATRAADRPTPDDRRRRFLNPSLRGLPVLDNPFTARNKARTKYPESNMREVLLSGCSDREYSYDALIEGTYHGAMTYYALQAIKAAKNKLTYQQLHDALTGLITDYPQSPQLEAKGANKGRQIFS
jgi:metacaspase-1